jgi:hypothetical protein
LGEDSHLWFERFYLGHGVPTIVWAVVAFLPFIAIYLPAIYLAGLFSQISMILLTPLPFYLLANGYIQYGSRYASSRMVGLAEEWKLVEKHSISLKPLFGLKGPTIFSLVVYVTFLPLFSLSYVGVLTWTQIILVNVLPWLYYAYFFGTFFWVLAYSAYSISRMGRLPLELKHFTEDRTLGLRDFGSVSLRLAALYVAFIALFAIPNTINGFVNLDFLLLYLALLLMAIPLFLLPLLSLHGKLTAEKRTVVAKFAPSYKQLVQELEANGTGTMDDRITDQLSATKQVLQEAGQIHTWPFDTGIIVRLSAIVLSVVAILASRVLAIIFHI